MAKHTAQRIKISLGPKSGFKNHLIGAFNLSEFKYHTQDTVSNITKCCKIVLCICTIHMLFNFSYIYIM